MGKGGGGRLRRRQFEVLREPVDDLVGRVLGHVQDVPVLPAAPAPLYR